MILKSEDLRQLVKEMRISSNYYQEIARDICNWSLVIEETIQSIQNGKGVEDDR